MNRSRRTGSFLLPLLGLIAAVPPARAASRSDSELLALIPEDAISVGLVRLAELRSGPLAGPLFEETDRISSNGSAARFMEDAGLRPREDVDVVVASLSGDPQSGNPRPLLFFAGRFDPVKLSAAALGRGAIRASSEGAEYFRLPEGSRGGGHGEPGAVAFLDERLVIAGSEAAVARALVGRADGGTGFVSGRGLGRELGRVNTGSTAWALVDVEKLRRWKPEQARGAAAGVVAALQSVSLFSMEARVSPDALELSATGVSSDEATRELLEDSLRGLTAAWRMAVQEKSPELVSAIRRFRITRDDTGVTISGSLSGDLIRTLTDPAQRRHASAGRPR